MHKVLLVAGAVYNQCMIYYLRNNASCDNSVPAFYVKFRQSALYGCYLVFLLFLIALARSCNPSSSNDASKDPPSVVALLFVALLLGYNVCLLLYLLKTKECGANIGTTNATIGKGLIVMTCLFIVVDLVLLVKGIHERRQHSQMLEKAESESR